MRATQWLSIQLRISELSTSPACLCIDGFHCSVGWTSTLFLHTLKLLNPEWGCVYSLWRFPHLTVALAVHYSIWRRPSIWRRMLTSETSCLMVKRAWVRGLSLISHNLKDGVSMHSGRISLRPCEFNKDLSLLHTSLMGYRTPVW